MKYKTIEEIMERRNQIKAEMEKEGADLDALEKEVRELKENEEELRRAAQADAEKRRMIADGLGNTQQQHTPEPAKPGLAEIRKSKAYIDAYAEYIKTGDDRDCRTLLTTNAPQNGTIPVPEFLQSMIETAWEKDEILSRVSRSYIKGNLKVPFELSADPAVVHPEGSAAPAEENITFGLVELKPETIKKWVSFSDEVQAMKGEEFLRYIFDELTYRVTRKLADKVIDDVLDAPAANSATAIGVPELNANPGLLTIPDAVAHLHEDARNLVIIMNRLTEVEFLSAYASGNFAIDPFAGIPRIYTSHLPAYPSTESDDTYAIVGDLSALRVNFPEGDGMVIKYDDLTRKKEDIVEVLGRIYAGHAITKLGRFVKINTLK